MIRGDYLQGPACVVYHNEGPWYWRWLRPGYRGCFLLVEVAPAGGWVALCLVSGRIDVAIADTGAPEHYERRGMRVQRVTIRASAISPWPGWTCVELAKRVIGVRAWWVWTPHQLAMWLDRRGGDDAGRAGPIHGREQTTAAACPRTGPRSCPRTGPGDAAAGRRAGPRAASTRASTTAPAYASRDSSRGDAASRGCGGGGGEKAAKGGRGRSHAHHPDV